MQTAVRRDAPVYRRDKNYPKDSKSSDGKRDHLRRTWEDLIPSPLPPSCVWPDAMCPNRRAGHVPSPIRLQSLQVQLSAQKCDAHRRQRVWLLSCLYKESFERNPGVPTRSVPRVLGELQRQVVGRFCFQRSTRLARSCPTESH